MTTLQRIANRKAELIEDDCEIYDAQGELWLYDPKENRVYHYGAEVEMFKNDELFYHGQNQNGYFGYATLDSAKDYIRDNYGLWGEAE